jgi:FixJ family two-component response regulator
MKLAEASTVFVVDDDAGIRESIAALLETVNLRTELFESPEAFLRSTPRDAHGCLILDVSLPGINGLELQRHLRSAGFRIPILFLTAYGDIPMSVAAMKSGAVEFFTKPFDDQVLIDAIRRALERDLVLRDQYAETIELQKRRELLTRREDEVMRCVVAGLRNKEIASELGTQEITIKVHRAQVMRKMQADSLAELVRMTEKLRRFRSTPPRS